MAKKFGSIVITKPDFNGVIANQEFAPLITSNQVGDKFFVPKEDLLLVLGTGINARDSGGNEVLDENGQPVRRQVAQRFCAVRIIDNKPVDVRELFVGQIVKIDINRKIVFPGALSDALQTGKFKEMICGKCLQITEDKICKCRVWDNEESQYARDADDKLISEDKIAFKFEVVNSGMKPEDVEAALTMLTNYYVERFAEYVAIEE